MILKYILLQTYQPTRHIGNSSTTLADEQRERFYTIMTAVVIAVCAYFVHLIICNMIDRSRT